MKNIVYVVLDTSDEEQPVRVAKPNDYVIPTDKAKFTEEVILDLKTLVEGVLVIGMKLEESGIQAFDDTVAEVVGQLKDGWDYNNKTDEPEKED